MRIYIIDFSLILNKRLRERIIKEFDEYQSFYRTRFDVRVSKGLSSPVIWATRYTDLNRALWFESFHSASDAIRRLEI